MLDLVRWNPFCSFGRGLKPLWLSAPAWRLPGEAPWTVPGVNVFEDNGNVVVEAQVPGMKQEDLKLEVTGNRLNLRGETKQQSEKNDRNYHLKEVRFGSFERSVSLPAEVVAEDAKAELRDGILRVTLPKTEDAKRRTRRIKIQGA